MYVDHNRSSFHFSFCYFPPFYGHKVSLSRKCSRPNVSEFICALSTPVTLRHLSEPKRTSLAQINNGRSEPVRHKNELRPAVLDLQLGTPRPRPSARQPRAPGSTLSANAPFFRLWPAFFRLNNVFYLLGSTPARVKPGASPCWLCTATLRGEWYRRNKIVYCFLAFFTSQIHESVAN